MNIKIIYNLQLQVVLKEKLKEFHSPNITEHYMLIK